MGRARRRKGPPARGAEAAEWWPRYDEYLRPVEQAAPRTARRRATTSPHGKMGPMDLIYEESGL